MNTATLTQEEQTLLNGLHNTQKTISPAWFYDQKGSELFDQITELDEYYPTRTEMAIMRNNIGEIVSLIGSCASIIEFGSGSSEKIRVLLEHLDEPAAYVPVDISAEHLKLAAQRIEQEFTDLEVLPVVANFTHTFDLPTPRVMPFRNIVYFPGSTIGNFYPDEAQSLLDVMAAEAKKGGALLIGVDLKKDPAILERAYNDDDGVTAAFNLNMLEHINRRFGSDFNLDAFEHRALYNRDEGRIEMHLVSLKTQNVSLLGDQISFSKDETILTECSHKYTLEEFADMAARSGFEVKKTWVDDEKLFSVQYLER